MPPPGGSSIGTSCTTSTSRAVGSRADVGFITPHGADEVATIIETVTTLRTDAAIPLRILPDLVVFLADTPSAAAAHRAQLDELLGREYISDAEVFVGTPAQLADLLQQWQTAGADGFRLRPASIPHDLQQITGSLVPELQRRGVFRSGYQGSTLRDLFGLSRPANRYAHS
ncbi:MAG: FMNH2-utilizing monooxygenase [Mycobacterium sp.]|nr:FMNH2-utilizing monooxygenase [Mycobacterium sp.]